MRLLETGKLCIRALDHADLRAAGQVSAAAFGIDVSAEPDRRRWQNRLAFLLATDPEGSFVAERDGRVIGVAQAMKRERLWCLSLLAVQPGVQGAGAGRRLFDRTLHYGTEADAGLIVGSNDHRALRLYGLAGFHLLPTFEAEGRLNRDALPQSDPRIRAVGAAELEDLAAISREVRGAPHTAELEFMLDRGAVVLRMGDRGFVVVLEGNGVWLLAARDEESASALLWSALELAGDVERPGVRWITGDQRWAVDVVLSAGLRLAAYGALCVRGRAGRLCPFLPSGPFA